MSVLQVQVFGLYTREGFHENFDCPIKVSLDKAWISLLRRLMSVVISFVVLKVVALHPQFNRSNYKQFVTGGKKVSVCPVHRLQCVQFSTFPAEIIHPDCVPVKPNPAHLPSLLGSEQGVKGSYFSVSLVECSQESWPFSQSAVLSTTFERQCFTSTTSRCHYWVWCSDFPIQRCLSWIMSTEGILPSKS